jgi:two-component system, cell cycle response regulator
VKNIIAEMDKFGLGDDPSWFALVLFVRNLVNMFSIFTDEQKQSIQKYIINELVQNDPSPEHLRRIVSNLENLLVQNAEMLELKRHYTSLKEFTNSIALSINEFLGESFVSEGEREGIVCKFENEMIEIFEGEVDIEAIFFKLKFSVRDMLFHYRQEAQIWEKKARLLERVVNVDPLLAPLHNRSALDNYLRKAVKSCLEQQTFLSVLMIDIDNFKGVNDSYSHQVGDDVLRTLGKIINSHASKHNWFVARYGGDELVLVCDLCPDEALIHADAIRLAVQNYEFRPREGDKLADYLVKFTISIGVAEYKKGMTSEELLNVADKAMYQVKGTGKNNVAQFCVSQE